MHAGVWWDRLLEAVDDGFGAVEELFEGGLLVLRAEDDDLGEVVGRLELVYGAAEDGLADKLVGDAGAGADCGTLEVGVEDGGVLLFCRADH